MSNFTIPIVLFIFKRTDKLFLILDRISKISPLKLYLIGDGGRTVEEHKEIELIRTKVESYITWDCNIITRYANENIGVYANIAGGVKWVFQNEEKAIFLEDDNLPELSFFPFCEDILEYYKDDTRILWICGTNYLIEYEPKDNSSYVFTQHMMPCGWASWSKKFLKYYDGDLSLLEDEYISKRIKREKYYRPLMKQDWYNWVHELQRKKQGKKFLSWDYQMSFTERVHGMYAVVPKYNQITNIGVDLDSIHKGSSFNNEMTRRFCGLVTKEIEFPLQHPKALLTDEEFEYRVAKIITLPWNNRVKVLISDTLKKIFGFEHDTSLIYNVKIKIKQMLHLFV